MSIATGADVESICSKCGDVWHVIVAMVGDKIAKVQCKECGAYHRYRRPGGTKKKAVVPKKRSRSTGSTVKKRKSAKKEVEPEGPTVEPDMSRPVLPYKYTETYQPADRIDHPKFGMGVVEAAFAGKMKVLFSGGRRVLAVAKPEPQLERPPRFRHDKSE